MSKKKVHIRLIPKDSKDRSELIKELIGHLNAEEVEIAPPESKHDEESPEPLLAVSTEVEVDEVLESNERTIVVDPAVDNRTEYFHALGRFYKHIKVLAETGVKALINSGIAEKMKDWL